MTQAIPPKDLILYADDDPDDIELIKEAFMSYDNVELLTFSDGEALLTEAEYLPALGVLPCLIILDINMPRMSGKQVLVKLRTLENYENIPVILFSTSTLPGDADFARSLNAGFITKPLRSNQISMIADVFIDHCADEIKKRIHEEKKKKD